MVSKSILFVFLLVKTITSQRIPPYYPLYSEAVIEQYNSPQYHSPQYNSPQYIPPQYTPISPAENDLVCKNLASAIQNAVFDRFSQTCLRTPVFGPISTPLINEIKNSLCTCPACSGVNVSPNSYSKSYVPPSAVSNVIKASAPSVVPNAYPRGIPNVSVNRGYDIMALLKGLGCDCGCRGPVV